MSARPYPTAAAAIVLACVMTGCGERPKVYKPAQYQGKTDNLAWDNDRFKGNRVEWEKALKARSQGQNEYTRAGAGGK